MAVELLISKLLNCVVTSSENLKRGTLLLIYVFKFLNGGGHKIQKDMFKSHQTISLA